MISNTLLLFFAGLENGAANMAITAWALAKNPDVQEKLYQEIQEAISNNSVADDEKGMRAQHLDYNYLQNHMPYLEGKFIELLLSVESFINQTIILRKH